jgi:hypothetical protein
MLEKWLRLVALVNLVAFVFSNASGAMTVRLSAHSSECPCGNEAKPQPKEQSAASGCNHCRLDQENDPSEENQSICPTCGCSILDGICNCKTSKESSPSCPTQPQCPCPGGCVLCMAKVPCLVPAISFLLEAPCFGESLLEARFLCSQAFYARLIRPPRA